MPVRDQYFRLQLLDQIFGTAQHGLTAKEVLEALNHKLEPQDRVSLRTVQNDIIALRDGQIGPPMPLMEHRDGRQIYFRYREDAGPMYSVSLSPTEIQQVRQAIQLLERTGQYFLELEQLKQKLSASTAQAPSIEFDDNPDYVGKTWMVVVSEAIRQEISLKIVYQPFEREPYPIVLHPYRLREYNNRWYLCGLAEPYEGSLTQTVLALDRIQNLAMQPKVKYVANPFDPEYFEDVIGITVNPAEPIQRVRLHFEPSRAEYVRTKPLHRTQRGPHPVENDWQEFTIDVRFNRELVATILAFGEDVRVVEPIPLQHQVAQSLHMALGHYSK
jgi:predicted DNA-binding transcriptional regulator YafY